MKSECARSDQATLNIMLDVGDADIVDTATKAVRIPREPHHHRVAAVARTHDADPLRVDRAARGEPVDAVDEIILQTRLARRREPEP